VISLQSQGIDDTLSKGTWLLEFYAPWCGYCRQFEPVYEQIAKELKTSGSGVQVAKLNAAIYKGDVPKCAKRLFYSHAVNEDVLKCDISMSLREKHAI
jgi:thiol-disulfide isomerase/thioredoxin